MAPYCVARFGKEASVALLQMRRVAAHHLALVGQASVASKENASLAGGLLQTLGMEITRQIAALPVRQRDDGFLHVLLVTSRETGRWVIPKGWPWPDREEWMSAAEEAREEAGVIGRTHPASIGTFTYHKRRSTGAVRVRVVVYRLEVTEELAAWPECNERQRSWFTPSEAAAAVTEPELRVLITELQTVASP
jgi:8-oxo-dGTP pyrophosphatase MutT (NUDIX family)